jgi:hypothetical protein
MQPSHLHITSFSTIVRENIYKEREKGSEKRVTMADPDPAEAQRLCKELQLLVLQHLHEQGYKEVAHR